MAAGAPSPALARAGQLQLQVKCFMGRVDTLIQYSTPAAELQEHTITARAYNHGKHAVV